MVGNIIYSEPEYVLNVVMKNVFLYFSMYLTNTEQLRYQQILDLWVRVNPS